jgi:hypothetical protein
MSMQSAEDHPSSCAFTYSDGRQCRMLRANELAKFCPFHERKLRHFDAIDNTAESIILPMVGDFVPASALTHSLTRVFQAVAEGRLNPKQASALARVGDTLLKSICESKREFEPVCNDDYWSQLIWKHYTDMPEFDRPKKE